MKCEDRQELYFRQIDPGTVIASEQFLKTERKANMRKIIAAACLMAAMTLCVGCSSAKDGSKDTTKATTETKE